MRHEVERRRVELLHRVGVLPSEPDHGDGDLLADEGVVISVLRLSLVGTDPSEFLAKARAALPPGGRLVLLEPYRRPRWAGRLADLAAPLLRRLTGLQVNLPVPAMVRDAGFVIASIERVTMPTAIGPLRRFCLIVAQAPR